MAMVKLGDVAIEKRETWTGSTQGVPIVGLEHLVPGEITLSSWDSDTDNTFSKMFRKDQVLLGRRRVYLKKAVIAPFDGICSGDITVIEAIPEKISSRLLPFIIQNERFFDYAMQGSAGSLSPRVKWEHLKDYEFNLPDYEEQESLANKLWSALKLKESYHSLLFATDEMVKSRFIEMFGDPVNNPKRWPVMTMKESSVLLSDGPFGSNLKSDHYSETGIRVIRLQNICQGFFDDTDKAYVSEEHYRLLQKYTCKPGDIVIGTLGEPNLRACIIPSTVPISINKADCVHYIPKPNLLNTIFACAYINSPGLLYIASSNLHGTTRSRIAAGQVNQLPIYIPAIERQLEFARFYKQADKSKFELKQAIEKIDKVMRALLQ